MYMIWYIWWYNIVYILCIYNIVSCYHIIYVCLSNRSVGRGNRGEQQIGIYIDRYKYIHIYKQIDIEIERSFYYCLVYLCLFNSCTGDYSGDIFSAPLWSVLLLFSLSLSLSLYLTLTLFPRGNLENIPINIHIILHWYVHRWIER